ncbi:hypothetical protein ACFVVU_08115 [Kitasatospora sp. NPDC057965]|uniref:hypothetical protein n=1 Tax=Kitasatospora sp. NPDC057965 TaxID=3346291 RepID=UPI0036DD2385
MSRESVGRGAEGAGEGGDGPADVGLGGAPVAEGGAQAGDAGVAYGLDPGVRGTTAVRGCSVCGRSVDGAGLRQVWISLRVATDVLPLLVNACSAACVDTLPAPAEGYVPVPHTGGPGLVQPQSDWD